MGSALISKPARTKGGSASDHRREFEAEMRAKGYRRVTRWIPDVSSPAFISKYGRQMEAIAKHQQKFGPVDFLPPEEDVPGWN